MFVRIYVIYVSIALFNGHVKANLKFSVDFSENFVS